MGMEIRFPRTDKSFCQFQEKETDAKLGLSQTQKELEQDAVKN